MSPETNPAQTGGDPWHKGDRVRKLREDAGYREHRGQFADLVGVHRDSLAKYERQGSVPRAVANSIAFATGARIEWILDGELPVYRDLPPKKPNSRTSA